MVSTIDQKPEQRQRVLEIWLIVWVDIVDLDATRLVVLEVPDDLIGISLAPVARLACSVGDAAQRTTVVVGAYAGGLVDCVSTNYELANA